MNEVKDTLGIPEVPEDKKEQYEQLAALFLDLIPDAAKSFCEEIDPNRKAEMEEIIGEALFPLLIPKLESKHIRAKVARQMLSNLVAGALNSLIKDVRKHIEEERAKKEG